MGADGPYLPEQTDFIAHVCHVARQHSLEGISQDCQSPHRCAPPLVPSSKHILNPA